MPLFENRETVVRHIMVGDPKRFDPIRNSGGKRFKQGEIGNPIGPQLDPNLFTRLQKYGMEHVLLQAQLRQAASLSYIINKIFYCGEIVDAEGTEVSNRPKAVETIEFVKKTYNNTGY